MTVSLKSSTDLLKALYADTTVYGLRGLSAYLPSANDNDTFFGLDREPVCTTTKAGSTWLALSDRYRHPQHPPWTSWKAGDTLLVLTDSDERGFCTILTPRGIYRDRGWERYCEQTEGAA